MAVLKISATNTLMIHHYQLRFLQHPNFHKMFISETGYPFTVENLMAFRAHETTQKKLKHILRAKGYILKATGMNQRQAFANAVDNKVTSEANLQWQTKCANAA